jgi:hypothetical protein
VLILIVTPCYLVDGYQHFGGTYHIHPQDRSKTSCNHKTLYSVAFPWGLKSEIVGFQNGEDVYCGPLNGDAVESYVWLPTVTVASIFNPISHK